MNTETAIGYLMSFSFFKHTNKKVRENRESNAINASRAKYFPRFAADHFSNFFFFKNYLIVLSDLLI